MKNTIIKCTLTSLLAISAATTYAQQAAAPPPSTAAPQTQMQKDVERYLRNNFALGPEIKVVVGSPKEVGTSGLQQFNVEVIAPEGKDTVKMYLSKDGRYLIRGDVADLTKDELAETRSKIDLKGAPVFGDPNAPITIVEFSDFECPVCRNLHDVLRGLLPKYPQVKLIFKDYPLATIHPWAMTAALAGRCAYQQNPKAFWKMYDSIYDRQDLISASDVYDKVQEYAAQAGLNADTFKACLSSEQAKSEVDASIANGNLLEVHSTPTVFVNGRRLVGADPHLVQSYIDYDLAQLAGKSPKK